MDGPMDALGAMFITTSSNATPNYDFCDDTCPLSSSTLWALFCSNCVCALESWHGLASLRVVGFFVIDDSKYQLPILLCRSTVMSTKHSVAHTSWHGIAFLQVVGVFMDDNKKCKFSEEYEFSVAHKLWHGMAFLQVVGFFMDDNKKYKLGEEYNEANLEKFCQGVVDGTAPVSGPPCVILEFSEYPARAHTHTHMHTRTRTHSCVV
eukprot:scaffold42948_cov16-Tisochrysis_lutea.AAC.1